MRKQSSSCQSWYFVWVFGYENEELILPKLVFCPFLELRMLRSSYQSWYFVMVFGNENEELILAK